jgi:hypothetical protein
VGGLYGARTYKKRFCHLRPNFRRKFAPDSIHSDKQDGWAAYGYLNWGD